MLDGYGWIRDFYACLGARWNTSMNFNRLPGRVFTFMIAASSFAAGTASAFTATTFASAITEARAIVQSEMAAKVPGFSVAVAVDGTNVWSEGFGYADLEAKMPVTTATRFRIGSVSKAITAAGLALLVEQGR